MVNFSNENIDINKLSFQNDSEELDYISKYINYGIYFTIIIQLKHVSPESEAEYAIKILNNFLMGKSNAFTSKNNIRANIESIDPFKITVLLIKSAVERYAFNIVRLHKSKMKSKEDTVAQTITEQISEGNLTDILTWINSDSRIIPMLVENYVGLSYQSDEELREAYSYMTSQDSKAKKAMEQLNSKLNSHNKKLK